MCGSSWRVTQQDRIILCEGQQSIGIHLNPHIFLAQIGGKHRVFDQSCYLPGASSQSSTPLRQGQRRHQEPHYEQSDKELYKDEPLYRADTTAVSARRTYGHP